MKVRNISFVPYLESEGYFICPLPTPAPNRDGKVWFNDLKPYERLYYHQTLNSVRKNKRFVQSAQIPRDHLDFQLKSRYDHSREAFPEKVDPVLQKETVCKDTSIVLRNTKTVKKPHVDKLGHPLRIGKCILKLNLFNIKLFILQVDSLKKYLLIALNS